MPTELSCFKAYDLRGRVPDELDADIARRVGRAFADCVRPGRTVIGRDMRLSSRELAAALAEGLQSGGSDVLDLGLCGTEEIYFATASLGAGGGIMVTASHNPADHNGMKFVRAGAEPISGDSGLREIQARTAEAAVGNGGPAGSYAAVETRARYLEHLLGWVPRDSLRPLTLVVNAGNGMAGPIIDGLEPALPFRFVKMQHEPDGRFPHGVPNPLLAEQRGATGEAVLAAGADFGVAWDGDFDRCFLFDEHGRFIEGYYLVGLLAEVLLQRCEPGQRVVHDPRLVWNTREIVRRAGGVPVQSKTGHAFIKERMRREDAVYGGEMSAHHYFRDFFYCDSGMIPWLLVAALVSSTGRPLSSFVDERMALFPVSGEINRRLADPEAALERVRRRYQSSALAVDETDGLSLEFETWRFNLRKSNTEPLIRLNVETRADAELLAARTRELLALLDVSPGVD